MVLTACQSEPPEVAVIDLPPGDVGSGEKLYLQSIDGAPTCISCHALSDEDGLGPGLAGYGDIAGERVEGESAEEYTYYSIIRTAHYVVPGYSNIMYAEYESVLEPADIADLIAYLLEL